MRASIYQTDLKFVELTSPDVIKQWKTRPVFALDGFDALKYRFTRAEFYRWHVPVPGREGFDQGAIGASTDRLALAIRVVSPRGERWFNLTNPEESTADLLYIQQRSGGASDRNLSETVQPAGSTAYPTNPQKRLSRTPSSYPISDSLLCGFEKTLVPEQKEFSSPEWGLQRFSSISRIFSRTQTSLSLPSRSRGRVEHAFVKAEDNYHTHILEQRPGFRAFDAVLTAMPGQANLGHVLYWIGLEAVDGRLVSNAVRLASDGFVYGGCGQEYREGTATSIRKKADIVEATLRVQGQFEYEYTNPYPTEGPNCVWASLLHWKPGAGFRVRKLADNCKFAHQEVTITEDGVLSPQDAKSQ